MEPVLNGMLEKTIEAVALEKVPELWNALPKMAKQEIIRNAHDDVSLQLRTCQLLAAGCVLIYRRTNAQDTYKQLLL